MLKVQLLSLQVLGKSDKKIQRKQDMECSNFSIALRESLEGGRG